MPPAPVAAAGSKTCPQCQTANGPANRFCEGCGFPFPADAAPQPPPPAAEAPPSFVPPAPPPPAPFMEAPAAPPVPPAQPPDPVAAPAPRGVSLVKGGNVSLVKAAPGLTHIMVGLGWSARTTTGADFDLDASALACNSAGTVLSDSHFVFFNNLTSPEGALRHAGDNRTGDAEGDDEVIHVDLAKLPEECARVVFAVTIYDESQNFGQVRDAYIRVANEDGGAELARYDLSEDASVETAMVFGELYRGSPTEGAVDWKFRAVGQGYANGLAGIARDFGVNMG